MRVKMFFIQPDEKYLTKKKSRYLAIFSILLVLIVTPLPFLWHFTGDMAKTVRGGTEVVLAYIVCIIILLLIRKNRYKAAANFFAISFTFIISAGVFAIYLYSPLQSMTNISWLSLLVIFSTTLFCDKKMIFPITLIFVIQRIIIYILLVPHIQDDIMVIITTSFGLGLSTMILVSIIAYLNVNILLDMVWKNIDLRKKVEKLNLGLEKKVKERTKEVEKLNDLKNRFLSIAAHDLKNPLLDIKLSLLEITDKKDMENIITTINYMHNLLDNLLDVTMIESGKLNIHFTGNDYKNFIHERILMKQNIAKKRGILLRSNIKDIIPILYFDINRITQVINNLLDNAIKFSPHDSTITISVHADDENVVTRIIDQGIGILPEDIHKVHKKNEKSSPHGYSRKQGTGLGLSIVREIIAAHRGIVSIESEPGKGTEVRFTLPIYHE